ncbi:hypothetical protein [Streptomyces cacaoi]|uniref:hypothetical protein n=1 Tax=Streptomyces cacaoi TaxID=1898 RepID=UPI003747DCC8
MTTLPTLGEWQPIKVGDAEQRDSHQQRISALEKDVRELRDRHAEPRTDPRPAAATRRAGALRSRAAAARATARRWAVAVIAISTVITVFGSGNAHDVLAAHHTPEPWGWFLYPALEAGLIVEIQIGGALAEHGRRVRFWGGALRVVTAAAAVTVCVYGPAENGDVGGAVLHAIGPFVQFWLAEFLAAARAQFKTASEKLLREAEEALAAPDETPVGETSSHPPSHVKQGHVSPKVSPGRGTTKKGETKRETRAKPTSRRSETQPKQDPQKVSPISDIDREVSQIVALMEERGGPDTVTLDRDVVPLLSHLSRATCDRRLGRARDKYKTESKTA